MIEVESPPSAVRVTVPHAELEPAALETWLNWLRTEVILQKEEYPLGKECRSDGQGGEGKLVAGK